MPPTISRYGGRVELGFQAALCTIWATVDCKSLTWSAISAKELSRLRRHKIIAVISLECYLLAVLGFDGIVEFDRKLGVVRLEYFESVFPGENPISAYKPPAVDGFGEIQDVDVNDW